MAIKSKKILEQIRPEDKNLLSEKELVRKFGRPEDCVELHIYDLNGNLLDTVYNFEEYEIPDVDDNEGFFNEITFNPDKALRDLGYSTGEYELRVNFHRKKIVNTLEDLFYINTISPSRTELRVKIIGEKNLSPLISATSQFIAELGDTEEGIAYFKDFALNLGDDTILTGVNFIAEQGQNNSFLIKLYEPLPNTFSEKAQFRIIEELTNPISYRVDLGVTFISDSSKELRGPNLRIDTRLNSSTPTAYRAYNDILKYSSTGSLNNVLNALSSSAPISVEYDNPNTDSGYVYDKFIHFSSAEERLRNFKYKLELIELYTSKSEYIDTLSPPYVTGIKQNNEDLKNKVIQNFDGYERYLYFESGTYAWPKITTTKPYTLAGTNRLASVNWFNTNVEDASNFDDQNPYILRNTLPQYIMDNDQNEHFITFIDMVGQHFDNIWLYIENITDKNVAHNSLTEGISKDLVFNALKEKGIPAFDQFENKDLFSYLLFDDFNSLEESAFQPIIDEAGEFITTEGGSRILASIPTTPTIISGSNSKTPLQDISKGVWKRLYHNAPYLLKTKGTERGIKALLSCYGIPESILHVKEYGGPVADKSEFRTFKYPKIQKAVEISGTNIGTKLRINYQNTTISDNAATIEFTIIPSNIAENIILSDTIEAGAGYISLDRHPVHTDTARLKHVPNTGTTVYSDYFPAYCGRPLTIFLQPPTANQLKSQAKSIGNLNVKASMFVDGEYIEKTLSTDATFKQKNTTNLPISIGQSSYINGKTSNFLVHNFKIYNVPLNTSIREQHTKDPNILAANTTSSFFENELMYYIPLGANLKEDQPTTGAGFKDFSYSDSTTSKALIKTEFADLIYKEVTYDHFIVTPDTVGASMVSEKVRYDQGTIDDNILSPIIRAEKSTLDRQPQDFSNLGIFFSPTFEINEDIIHTLGGFRLDDYIGDPRHLSSSEYPDLKSLRKTYAQKVTGRYNFWDYLRTIQFFDHTIFKLIEEFVPVKANLKTGFVIEPNYLERNKINYANTDFSQISFPDFNVPDVNPSLDSEYILHETTINVEDVLDGSEGSFENNFVYGRLSSKYYRVAENR